MTYGSPTTQVATVSTYHSLQDQEVDEADEVPYCSFFCKSLTTGRLDP